MTTSHPLCPELWLMLRRFCYLPDVVSAWCSFQLCFWVDGYLWRDVNGDSIHPGEDIEKGYTILLLVKFKPLSPIPAPSDERRKSIRLSQDIVFCSPKMTAQGGCTNRRISLRSSAKQKPYRHLNRNLGQIPLMVSYLAPHSSFARDHPPSVWGSTVENLTTHT